MAIDLKSGPASVAYTGFIGSSIDDIERDMVDLLGPILEEIQREADQIHAKEIAAHWPVKTGRSLRAWDTQRHLDADLMTVATDLVNPYKYTRYIKSTKDSLQEDAVRMRSPLSALVRKPATKARRRLKKTLPLMLADLVQRMIDRG